jgi:N6-L-threonylcarbamoyladenine synthase
MKILAIETSCDETAISIIEVPPSEKTLTVLSNIVVSQIELHKPYGGVFPMLAKREHAKNLVPVLETALREAKLFSQRTVLRDTQRTVLCGILEREPELLEVFLPFISSLKIPKIDAIAFTRGPGLAPALWVGVNFARALSVAWEKPLVPINHMEGHMLSSLLKKTTITKPNFPILALLISGGHTEIVLAKDLFKYKIVGTTRDDAVGEAFDKTARILGLPYPGGPEISKRAENFRKQPSFAKATAGKGKYKLPRPMIHSDDFDFSFSGIKTAVLYMVQKIPEMTEEIRNEICYEFEEAVTETLLSKTMRSAEKYNPKMILLGGGVASNSHIQKIFKESFSKNFSEAEVFVPEQELSTDNALMIALAGYLRFSHDKKSVLPAGDKRIKNLKADGNWSL